MLCVVVQLVERGMRGNSRRVFIITTATAHLVPPK